MLHPFWIPEVLSHLHDVIETTIIEWWAFRFSIVERLAKAV